MELPPIHMARIESKRRSGGLVLLRARVAMEKWDYVLLLRIQLAFPGLTLPIFKGISISSPS